MEHIVCGDCRVDTGELLIMCKGNPEHSLHESCWDRQRRPSICKKCFAPLLVQQYRFRVRKQSAWTVVFILTWFYFVILIVHYCASPDQ